MTRRCALLLAGLLLGGAASSPAGPRPLQDLMTDMRIAPLEPQAPPPLSVTTLEGASVSLADMRGHVVLVYFWATW